MRKVKVSIGDMRTRIVLQSPTIVTDAGGAKSQTYADVVTVWAEWINDSGAESLVGGALRAAQQATVRIRYYSAVLSSWRIVRNGQVWAIIAPPDHIYAENRYTELTVQSVKGSV